MLRIAFAAAALSIAAISWGAEPALDNDRVSVWDTTQVLPPLANTTGYPLAFPRPHARKLLENDKVVVWSYTWRPHEPTPMHFHDKEALVVFEATGALQSTTADGKSTVSEYRFGDIRFNGRDRTHTEVLVRGNERAVITELK
jgi:hypothetical protein